MDIRYHLPVILSFLLYFTSFLTGRPGVEVDPYAEKGSYASDQHSDENFSKDYETESVKKTNNWKTGLITRVYLQKKSRDLFDDPLLISDARPENFFKYIDRTLTGDTFFLFLDIVWIAMFILAIIAFLKKHWFYHSFLKILLYPTIIFLLVILLTTRRETLIISNAGLFVFMEIILETLLLFMGLALVFKSSLPHPKIKWIPFMEHLSDKFAGAGSTSPARMESLIQILVLVAAGLVLSNLILLPIYKLQLTFPGMFAMLFLFALVSLGFFYTTAYMKVSSSGNNEVSFLSGISFLGYRILRNTIFIVKIILIVSFTIAALVFLADSNIKLLELIQFIQKNTGFQ